MRRFESLFSWLILIGILAGAGYWYPREIRTVFAELYAKFSPCTTPITYRIDSIDPQFGISQAQLKTDLQQATALWNTAAKKEVFAHDQENGILQVSLAYDARQEMTTHLKSLGVTVSNDRESYDQVKAKYDGLFGQYRRSKTAFDQKVSAFNVAKKDYEQRIAYWNKQGGAPRVEFQQLQSESDALKVSGQHLQNEQTNLNALARDVNDLALALNKLIVSLKLDVEKYNSTGLSQGDSFEEGVYERTVGKETITIFEYENNALLTRVLAHELGHALGLEHVEDPKAIMYYLNQGSKIALTRADIEALSAVCKPPL